MMMLRFCRPLLPALVALSSPTACDPPKPVPVHASRAYTDAALALAAPPADHARVFVFSGMYEEKGRWVPRGTPSDIYVNDIKIGALETTQVMVFDVVPGQYAFSWKSYGRSYALLEKPVPSVHTLAGGTNLMLQNDLSSMRYLMSPLHGSFYLISERRISPDFEVVRPSTCPPTICLP